MVENATSLPAGAGATTSNGDQKAPLNSTTPVAGLAPTSPSQANAPSRQSSAGSSYRESGYSGRGDLVLLEERSKPSTATVVGAAVAGAIVGGAIPFMLSSRSSSRSSGGPESAVVTESVIVNRSARELYDFWRNFTNFPQFMDNVKSVEKLDEKRSHWIIKAPAGTSVEFNSRVTEDVPGRAISWQSEEGATVSNRGRVEFVETSNGNATNVRLTISYEPPAGTAGRMVAKLFRREPSVQAREDLDRFKRLMETAR